MSDVHALPLRGRELPETGDNVAELSREDWLALQKKARVYRSGPSHWTWDHKCAERSIPLCGYPHRDQATAFGFAWDHVKRCVG